MGNRQIEYKGIFFDEQEHIYKTNLHAIDYEILAKFDFNYLYDIDYVPMSMLTFATK